MSKAFTKEPEDLPEPKPPRRGAGSDPNYMTPAGARIARVRRGRDVHRRSPHSRAHLITSRPRRSSSRRPIEAEASLGASVTVETEAGKRTKYRIVGAPRSGSSAVVVLAIAARRVLYGAHVGDSVTLPRGDEVEIIALDYE